ncbi:fumarylacetoacetate hydrolase family protein [Caloramator sp. E03]|uniref:fumarylacetoacetate hydrolase family protein n=1 Tax=Caloramator sp. E03 TaxID=2576307 RepID=UPI001110AA63|nr:fumarylacetoacetate hydrolase family protein [Caloramator sp. E03]QCX34715.1 fumarylacetoacetate hydrolase family protein [Caloramator sp. E03]
MKFVNFKLEEKVRLGIKTEKGIIDVEKAAADFSMDVPLTIEEVISAGEDALKKLKELAQKTNKIISEEEITYAPCVTNPEKIICVGLNYLSHTSESKMNVPTVPVLFSKFNNALAAHNQIIPLPKYASKFDYEAELVIVIGKEGKDISKEEALSYVFGYTAGNDISARDLQFLTGQWLLGKTSDFFAPIGPYLTTKDEIDPKNLKIECKVNGVIRQSANTRDMIFDCAEIVSYVSRYMTLKKGDIIFTGTPGGVILGYPEEKQIWLKSGDRIEISIENIGH